MKKLFTLISSLLIILFTPGLLFSQQNDNSILLKSGSFIPEENISSVTKNSNVFQKSLYGNKHYVTIQFYALPDQAEKERLKAAGIELIDYIPNKAFTASVFHDFNLSVFKSFAFRSVFQFSTEQKIFPGFLTGEVPAHAIKRPGYADVTVISYEKINADAISGVLAAMDATIVEDFPMFRSFTIRVAQKNISQLTGLSFVQWVEFIPAPNQEENLPGRSLHRVNVLQDGPRNLKGDGVNVGIWDAGEISPHLDFLPASRLNQIEFNSPQSHSTHCSGTILGRGIIDPRAKGMAPNATLYSYNYNGNIQTEMAAAIPLYNLIVSSHSYNDGGSITCNLTGTQIQYTTVSRNTDLNLNNFPYHLHCHSSGNAQTSCSGGWYTITGTGKSAKNNIVVGSLTSSEALSSFSSCGPVADGRIKPEITSMGSSVYSTYTPLNTYATISGTSMSTPGVAGSVTLLVQAYKQLNSNAVPISSLIKNAICNTAADLGNPGPDYRFGFGRINDLKAVRILEQNRYAVSTISTGNTIDVPITVPAGAARLRVMLTWNDPAAAANANPALVNNLDLTVINGPTTTLPWILNPNSPANIATRGVDNYSNIEQVTLDNPPSGTYTLRVSGTAIPSGPQQYALTWDVDQPYIEVIYPNGTESFNPNSVETITWDNASVTGSQTVEYSLNNGGSWTTISTTVPAATTRLDWSVPAGFTSTALVRVSSGALTDVSDANFKIMGTVTGFGQGTSSCTSGTVNFQWNTVVNATHYDIYRLNTGTGQWDILGSNITGTTYSATGLTPGASLWFTIEAKNNTTGAVSIKAFAINLIVSSGGVGTIGSISGNTTICGPTFNVSYSVPTVPGATSYTWTVPPGANIGSGQGTNTILANYPVGSNSGNVTVFATSGSCQTATASLSVAVSSNTIAAPTSGGNQSATACPPTPIPTLTATATVPAGQTVIWFDAPSGGNVISSPTLNSIGTITFYAESEDISSGCKSNTRTAVTLTITQMPASTVTANGPTTFCQGGSVMLTANPGTSYLWSNGATTQSITVSASGSFSVTVNHPNGCSNTSPATSVTVNSIPSTTITASGPTTFCVGDNVVLTATAGNAYIWSNGATNRSITVTTSGSYTVTVTHTNGCISSSAATVVSVSPRPLVTISASPYMNLFPGLSTTLTANVTPPGTYNYAWFKNAVLIPGATSNTISGINLDGIGSYTVTVTNTTGLACSNTSPAVAIGDSATSKLFIYPSPNNGNFRVVYYSPGTNVKNTLTIYDSKGALVLNQVYTLNSPYQAMNVDMSRNRGGLFRVVLINAAGKKVATGTVSIY
jgi:Subtilase family/PKD-like domain/Ig-like domain CHU_C associated